MKVIFDSEREKERLLASVVENSVCPFKLGLINICGEKYYSCKRCWELIFKDLSLNSDEIKEKRDGEV